MVIVTERFFPLVVSATIGDVDDRSVATYGAAIEQVFARAEPYVMLTDARRANAPDARASGGHGSAPRPLRPETPIGPG